MSISAPTILIVDDDPQNRRLLAVLLRPEGYQTRDADSGEEALRSVAQSAPDLILLDIMMAGIDGYEVASILKANPTTANIPIIMVTAHGERRSRLAGLEAGAEEFLTKPVDRSELWLRVRNLLRLKAFGDLQVHSFLLEQQVAARTAELQRFRTAMDETADAIMLISLDTQRFVEVNATSCKMLGYTHDEMLAMGPAALGLVLLPDKGKSEIGHLTNLEDKRLSEEILKCKDGSVIQVEISQKTMLSGNDWLIVSIVRDITERKVAQQKVEYLSSHDSLTGLPNRNNFYETLRKTARYCQHQWKLAVMFIDIDYFKNVNDTLGHVIGDDLLIQFGDRLSKCIRTRDNAGRLGGDEFGLMVIMENGKEGAAQIAAKIQEVLRPPFYLQGYEVVTTASIGIAIYPDDDADPDVLIKYADTAMYQAKHAGRNTYRFFTPQMNIDMLRRQGLENALRKAIENGEFILHYQPKVALVTGDIVGVEALLRWVRPDHAVVGPSEFIPVLEDCGLIVQVGRWVIDTACRQIKQWQMGAVGPIKVAVNVAMRQFVEGDFAAEVAQALSKHNIPAGLLELELTESSLMVNTEDTMLCLRSLRATGVTVSIDDFGTGYSSLAYLRRFPIDSLKIDIAFIREVTSNTDDAAIVNAIIVMAHSLNLIVIAEGVETVEQWNFLQRHACDQMQGYLVSPSLPTALMTELIIERRLGLLSGKAEAPSQTSRILLNNMEPL